MKKVKMAVLLLSVSVLTACVSAQTPPGGTSAAPPPPSVTVTNQVTITNTVVVTNFVAAPPPVIVTNTVLATNVVTRFSTNYVAVTNVLTLVPTATPPPVLAGIRRIEEAQLYGDPNVVKSVDVERLLTGAFNGPRRWRGLGLGTNAAPSPVSYPSPVGGVSPASLAGQPQSQGGWQAVPTGANPGAVSLAGFNPQIDPAVWLSDPRLRWDKRTGTLHVPMNMSIPDPRPDGTYFWEQPRTPMPGAY